MARTGLARSPGRHGLTRIPPGQAPSCGRDFKSALGRLGPPCRHYVDEQLAKHYGIPNVLGSRFGGPHPHPAEPGYVVRAISLRPAAYPTNH